MVEVKVTSEKGKETHFLVLQTQDLRDLESGAVINMPVEANHVRIFFHAGTRDEILERFSEVGSINQCK